MKSAYVLLSFLCLFLFVFFFFPFPAQAQTNPFYEQNPLIIDQQVKTIRETDNTNNQTSIFGGAVQAHSVISTLDTVRVMILGRTIKADVFKNEQGGAVGQVALLMGKIYANPPASGLAYTQHVLADIGLAPKAYAQGIGFAGLEPLLPLWAAMRNIAYSILIIVMVVIGFMVIFRMKIDPKTVISIQAALPKIIVTLILITFSYAIAGFMIDLMYVAMALVINILANALKGISDLPDYMKFMIEADTLQTKFITGGYGELIGNVMFRWEMVAGFFKQFFGGSAFNWGVAGIAQSIAAIAGLGILRASPVGLLVTALPVLLLLVIIGLGLLFTLIRLTFLLLNSYVQLIVSIVIGPLFLLQEAIPGRSAFAQWMQNLIANLIVFPATVVIIYTSWIFTGFSLQGGLWVPPLTLAGGGGEVGGLGNPLGIFIGLGIIFMSPNLVAQIKKAFHPSSALPITAGSAFSPLTGGVSTGMGAMSQFYYMQQLWGGHGQPGPLQSLLNTLTGGALGGKGGGEGLPRQ